MYELIIAARHLRARRRRSLSVVTWLAVAGVALGVTALVGGFSITTGFEQAFREKVLGITAHLFVREYGLRFERYRDVEEEVARVPGVKATSPMTFNEAMFSGRTGTAGAVVKGIVPERAQNVLALPDYLEEGRLADLPGRGADGLDRIILGAELARSLGVSKGDAVTLVSPLRSGEYNEGPASPRTRAFRVAGVFRAGFHEYDARLAYMELSAAQDFFGTGDTVMGIEVAVHEPLMAGQIGDAVRKALGDGDYSVLDWRRQNKNLFASLTYQRIAILVVLSVMVVLASCNVACMLIMLVLERTRDIAILKAMGARDGSILRIFVFEGLAIGALGTIIGMAVAYGLCEGLLKNGIALDPKVYGIERLPVVFSGLDYLMAGVGALVITFVAAIFPAIRGARLHPVDGLRETHA
ncbi:MAG: ABC transporter permease [Myxococcales bacterium]|nr:ABC transporter permease [Myxococcales bacterium]MCB9548180.1 ABC transporter permease [Myxococcales bacterium]